MQRGLFLEDDLVLQLEDVLVLVRVLFESEQFLEVTLLFVVRLFS